MSAEGAKIEAPQAPREVGAVRGVPLPLGEGSGDGAVLPPQKIFEFLKMTCFGALWSMDFICACKRRQLKA